LDRLIAYACQFFGRTRFEPSFFDQIDRWLRLEYGPDSDTYAVPLKTVADLVEAKVTNSQGGVGQGKDAGKKKRRGGKPPLEKTNSLKFQIYERIQREHQPGEDYADVVSRLKEDKDFGQQVKDAGLKLTPKLVRAALAFFDQRKRDAARKKQETDPA
jgi:hypothetical protein